MSVVTPTHTGALVIVSGPRRTSHWTTSQALLCATLQRYGRPDVFTVPIPKCPKARIRMDFSHGDALVRDALMWTIRHIVNCLFRRSGTPSN